MGSLLCQRRDGEDFSLFITKCTNVLWSDLDPCQRSGEPWGFHARAEDRAFSLWDFGVVRRDNIEVPSIFSPETDTGDRFCRHFNFAIHLPLWSVACSATTTIHRH